MAAVNAARIIDASAAVWAILRPRQKEMHMTIKTVSEHRGQVITAQAVHLTEAPVVGEGGARFDALYWMGAGFILGPRVAPRGEHVGFVVAESEAHAIETIMARGRARIDELLAGD
jgi:hypothetical protein